jgi:UV DNA damage endonuclease
MFFFRITSDLVPFASHPVCKFNWQRHFKKKFERTGDFVKKNKIRISMHPDQFILINSPDKEVHKRSLKELLYHADLFDLMKLNTSAKIQIHVGGVYGNKKESIKRFIRRYNQLDQRIKRRLVIENDERNYSLSDCMKIHSQTKIPVLFDLFHHQLYGSKETPEEAFERFVGSWAKNDGIPMVDYSSPQKGKRKGKHTETIDLNHFKKFLKQSKPFDFDIMLEIKDKEKSTLKAVAVAAKDNRFFKLTKNQYDSKTENQAA